MTLPFALIIEDDPQIGAIFSLALDPDFKTELCDNGSSAIARLDQVQPDLIILDLHLPGASGLQVLDAIHARPNLANTKVILATADHQQADYLRNQADIVLLKPISPIQLSELSIRLCQKPA